MTANHSHREPIVITGIGMIASLGDDRESVWRAVQRGQSGVRRLTGLRGIPDGLLIGAPVDIEVPRTGRLKVFTLCERAAAEAVQDAAIDWESVDRDRFACCVSNHMGDSSWIVEHVGKGHLLEAGAVPWYEQWIPSTACTVIGDRYGLTGPRSCHATACATGLVEILSAVRTIRDGRCDIALVGGGEAIDPLVAAGFRQMRVLAHDDVPQRACRPFDRTRSGFVLGEGAAMFVIERLGHALARGASIYAELASGKILADAHHVTDMDAESEALTHLISTTVRDAGLDPADIGYLNAHGTGTRQNDQVETRGIRQAMGRAADSLVISSNKSMLGHLIHAAGSVELAITVLAMRDGFAPPTLNLTTPDPKCDLDCIPLVGRPRRFDHAMKLSVAFGGHLAAVVLRRWNDSQTGFSYPSVARAA